MNKVDTLDSPYFANFDDFILLTDTQEVEAVKEHLGIEEDFDFFLVKIDNGDYSEVWGGYGFPYIWKAVYRVK